MIEVVVVGTAVVAGVVTWWADRMGRKIVVTNGAPVGEEETPKEDPEPNPAPPPSNFDPASLIPGNSKWDWKLAKSKGLFSCGYQDTVTGYMFIEAPDAGKTFADKTTCLTYPQYFVNGTVPLQYLVIP